MKAAVVCAFLLTTVTASFSKDGTISVFNNGTDFNLSIYLSCKLKRGAPTESIILNPAGGTSTQAIPENAKHVTLCISFYQTLSRCEDALFKLESRMPLSMCLMSWGTSENPQIGQVDCNPNSEHTRVPSDGGALVVTNNGTHSSQVIILYDSLYEGEQPVELFVNPGETERIAIDETAKNVFVSLNGKRGEGALSAFFSVPVTLCFNIWGTHGATHVAQTNCHYYNYAIQ